METLKPTNASAKSDNELLRVPRREIIASEGKITEESVFFEGELLFLS